MKKAIKIMSLLMACGVFMFMAYGSGEKDNKKWESGNKDLFCGKKFYDTKSIEQIGMTVETVTTLNCDGTYTSLQDWKGDEPYKDEYNSTVGRSSDNNYNFSGTWEVVTDIPQEVKNEMTGFKDGDYTIIKYSSDNVRNRYAWIQPVENNKFYLSLLIFASDNPPSDGYRDEDYDLFGGFSAN